MPGELVILTERFNQAREELQATRKAATRTAEQLTTAHAALAQVDHVAAQQERLDEEIATYQAAYDRLNAAEQRASRAAAERWAAEEAAAERRAAEQAAAEAPVPEPDVADSAPAAPAAPSAPVGGGSAAAQTAVSTAMAQVGDPYVWAAAGPDAFDWSGLIQYAYASAGISLPHSSAMQSGMGTPVSRSALQLGDLLFFYSRVGHIGTYIGDGQMVHASTSGSPVKVSPVGYMPSSNSARRIAG